MGNSTRPLSSEPAPSIRSRGRRGSTVVPNWRWEDAALDPYELRVAGWLASHADTYLGRVTRNEIARRTGVSAGRVTTALARLDALGIAHAETIEVPQSEGGKRWVVTFNWDAWEREPRSPDDRDPGHDMTTPRSPGDHISTPGEEQQRSSSPDGDRTAEVLASFDRWWAQYPYRANNRKRAAQKAWQAMWRRGEIGRLRETWPGWRIVLNAREERHRPHASTFLNEQWYQADAETENEAKTPAQVARSAITSETVARRLELGSMPEGS